jgi:hypothetical protein
MSIWRLFAHLSLFILIYYRKDTRIYDELGPYHWLSLFEPLLPILEVGLVQTPFTTINTFSSGDDDLSLRDVF